MRRSYTGLALSFLAMVATPYCAAQGRVLDKDYAVVCMQVDVRASVIGLNDIILAAADVDGSSGADYVGSDTFTVESNAPVRIEVSGVELSNGAYTIASRIDIDGAGSSLITPGDGPHYGDHEVTVRATLGAVSAQLAGEYRARISLTVVPLLGVEPPCEEVVIERSVSPGGEEPAELVGTDAVASGTESDVERAALAAQMAADTPEQWQWVAETPEGGMLFPHLEEFKSWQSGESAVLSDEARYWWMFPQPEVAEAILNSSQ